MHFKQFPFLNFCILALSPTSHLFVTTRVYQFNYLHANWEEEPDMSIIDKGIFLSYKSIDLIMIVTEMFILVFGLYLNCSVKQDLCQNSAT